MARGAYLNGLLWCGGRRRRCAPHRLGGVPGGVLCGVLGRIRHRVLGGGRDLAEDVASRPAGRRVLDNCRGVPGGLLGGLLAGLRRRLGVPGGVGCHLGGAGGLGVGAHSPLGLRQAWKGRSIVIPRDDSSCKFSDNVTDVML